MELAYVDENSISEEFKKIGRVHVDRNAPGDFIDRVAYFAAFAILRQSS